MTMTPHNARILDTVNGTKGVEVILLYKYTGIFSLMKMAAVSSANLRR